jgi:hypothetical protein
MSLQVRKSLLFLVVILSVEYFATSILWASDKESEATTLINRALQLTDLNRSGPYHLRATLSVMDEALGKREGTDEVTFSSTDTVAPRSPHDGL